MQPRPQPLNSNLVKLAATASEFGLSLVASADAEGLRSSAGLGTLATQNGEFSGRSSGINTGDQEFSPSEISIVGTGEIVQYSPVTVRGATANSASSSDLGRVIGIAKENISVGFSGAIIASGLITNSGWSWSMGAPIFVNGTGLSMTPPSVGFVQIVGVARTSDTIFVKISEAYLL